MIERLYELLTGKPYYTGRCASEEFGPTPGARYEIELMRRTNAELIGRERDELLAEVRDEHAEREAAFREFMSGKHTKVGRR